MAHPAIDTRAFVDDERYAAYRQSLVEKRGEYERHMLRPGCDPRTMDRLAGAITTLDWALGLPDVLLASDPTSSPTP